MSSAGKGQTKGYDSADEQCASCGQRHPTDEPCDGPASRLGMVVGDKYELVRLIAQGGMGTVYLARHTSIGRRLAVKFLHTALLGRREMMTRFRREAQLAGSLENEHIAAVTDFGFAGDGVPYIVMEYLDGQDLGSLFEQQGLLPVPRIVEMIIQACYGLEAAHERRVIHRDLKPENLFICRRTDGADLIKILDFGIAKLCEHTGEPALTRTGVAMGTPNYMAPEQVRGDRTLDHRVDIYALGVILYEGLSGRLPHPGTTYHTVLNHILTQPAVALDSVRRGLPNGLAEVVHRALDREAEERFADIVEFRRALDPFAARKRSIRPPAARGLDRSAPTHEALDAEPSKSGDHDATRESESLTEQAWTDSVSDEISYSDTVAVRSGREMSATDAALVAAGIKSSPPNRLRRWALLAGIVAVGGIALFLSLGESADSSPDDRPASSNAPSTTRPAAAGAISTATASGRPAPSARVSADSTEQPVSGSEAGVGPTASATNPPPDVPPRPARSVQPTKPPATSGAGDTAGDTASEPDEVPRIPVDRDNPYGQ